jgi:hypothetical protein
MDQPWGLGETRIVQPSAQAWPERDAAGGDFSVFVPLGVPRRFLALAARDSLAIDSGARITEHSAAPGMPRFAFTSSMGRAVVSSAAQIGPLYTFGAAPPLLQAGAAVHGYVETASTIGPTRAHVDMGILDHVDGYAEEFRWRVDFSRIRPEAEAVGRATDATALPVAPGGYASLTVEPGGIAVIRTGTYVVDALDVRSGATLEIDNTSGPVYVWVRHLLALRGKLLDYVERPTFMVGYAGEAPPIIATAFRGTLVAPDTEVTVPSAAEAHVGAFFARSVKVERDAAVEHEAFTGADARVDLPAFVCGRCALVEKMAARRCCNDYRRSASIGRAAGRTCASSCDGHGLEAADSCRRTCTVAAGDAAADAAGELDVCLSATALAANDCAQRYQYRRDTCAKVGFATALDATSFCPREEWR